MEFSRRFCRFRRFILYLCALKVFSVLSMKKKNSIKIYLASAVMLLMASPAFAQKYKVAKVERTRILVDQKWDAQPDAEAARFIAPYKSKVDSIMGPDAL